MHIAAWRRLCAQNPANNALFHRNRYRFFYRLVKMRRLRHAICGLMAIDVKNPPIIAPITPHDTMSCPVRYSPVIGVCTDNHSCKATASDRQCSGNHESGCEKRGAKATLALKYAQSIGESYTQVHRDQRAVLCQRMHTCRNRAGVCASP